MILSNLEIKSNSKGFVMHGMKSNENGYFGFKELYFSGINYNSIKGWNFHKKMVSNFIVPVGNIFFLFYDDRKNSSTYRQSFKILMSQEPFFRLTIPSNIWFCFKGLNKKLNLLVNLSNEIYNSKEIIKKNINDPKFIGLKI